MRALSCRTWCEALLLLLFVGVLSRFANALPDKAAFSRLLQRSFSAHVHRMLQGNGDDEESFPLLIPDIRVETQVIGLDLTIDLTSIECRDLIIESVQVELQAPAGNGIPVLIALSNVSIKCRADYDYAVLFGSGGGEMEIDVYDMAVASQVVFLSPNLAAQPPNAAWFNDCTSEVYIDRLEFDGDGTGIVASALNAAGPIVRFVRLVQCLVFFASFPFRLLHCTDSLYFFYSYLVLTRSPDSTNRYNHLCNKKLATPFVSNSKTWKVILQICWPN